MKDFQSSTNTFLFTELRQKNKIFTHESNGPIKFIPCAGALAILKSDPRGTNSLALTFKVDPSGVPTALTNLLLASKPISCDVSAKTSGALKY